MEPHQKKEDHSSDEEVASEVIEDLFNDESFYKPEPLDTFDVYERKFDHKDGTPQKITIRLAGSHPLWATKLWNAAKYIAEQIDDPSTDFHPQNKTVLELGAGGALPSLIAVLRGASKVVMTDYPDKPLLYCMEHNVNENIPAELKDRAAVVGHIWGKDIHVLTDELKKVNRNKFDAIICSDLLFNHVAHKALLETIHTTLEDNGKCYVTFSHHKVRKMQQDLVFFELAQQEPFNMKVEKVGEVKMTPMFEKDEGPAEIRATVHFYILRK